MLLTTIGPGSATTTDAKVTIHLTAIQVILVKRFKYLLVLHINCHSLHSHLKWVRSYEQVTHLVSKLQGRSISSGQRSPVSHYKSVCETPCGLISSPSLLEISFRVWANCTLTVFLLLCFVIIVSSWSNVRPSPTQENEKRKEKRKYIMNNWCFPAHLSITVQT